MLALACSLFLFVSLSLVRLLHVDSRPKRALKSDVPLRLFQLSLVFWFLLFLNQFFCLEIILFFPCFRRKRVQITFYEESGILGFFGFLKRTLFSRSSIKRPVEIRTARFQIWKYYGKLSEREREKRERESGERERQSRWRRRDQCISSARSWDYRGLWVLSLPQLYSLSPRSWFEDTGTSISPLFPLQTSLDQLALRLRGKMSNQEGAVSPQMLSFLEVRKRIEKWKKENLFLLS